ncbi:MogA/MoaB family molybdenum cofactor biosynthesis protein [Enemella sp. A6]|uniref:MogA/MoaB family molybdenum cofactor biosynthesis protein n=1 Tax=Enemella sp. A6 TaxID=3440152 RepID=UPI003EC03751
MSYRAVAITCSNRAADDRSEDRAGPVLREALSELGLEVGQAVVVPQDRDLLQRAIEAAIADGARIVFTVGGASIGPTDVSTSLTKEMVSYEIPGLMEEIRRVGSTKEPRALLSRGIAGVIDLPSAPPTLIVNSPGSRGGVRDTVSVVGPLLTYIVEQLDGAGHV